MVGGVTSGIFQKRDDSSCKPCRPCRDEFLCRVAFCARPSEQYRVKSSP